MKCRPGGTAATGVALLWARDAELLHLLLQRGALHAQAGRCALGAAHDPAAVAEGTENVLALRVDSDKAVFKNCRMLG